MPSSTEKILKKYSRVEYLGFVENPVREISACQALIAPLKKGAGVKVKVLDALSSGTPVIGTDIAFEGIMDNAKYKLFVNCESIGDFVSALNGWHTVNVEFKQAAADEFFLRYNSGHFTDTILPRLCTTIAK